MFFKSVVCSAYKGGGKRLCRSPSSLARWGLQKKSKTNVNIGEVTAKVTLTGILTVQEKNLQEVSPGDWVCLFFPKGQFSRSLFGLVGQLP